MYSLNNCPVCGGKARIIKDWCYPPMYWVKCQDCNRTSSIHKYMCNAVYEWNDWADIINHTIKEKRND